MEGEEEGVETTAIVKIEETFALQMENCKLIQIWRNNMGGDGNWCKAMSLNSCQEQSELWVGHQVYISLT